MDALLNIHIQRGSYVKASICKLHGRFLCSHFYLLSVCGDFVLSFTVFRAWLSLDWNTPSALLYCWLCYKILRQRIQTYFVRLLLCVPLLNYRQALWEQQCILFIVDKCSQRGKKKKKKAVEQCKRFPSWNLWLKVFCSCKQKNCVYPRLLKELEDEIVELLTVV